MTAFIVAGTVRDQTGNVTSWSASTDVAAASTTTFGANYRSTAQPEEALYPGRVTWGRIYLQSSVPANIATDGRVKRALEDGCTRLLFSWKFTATSDVQNICSQLQALATSKGIEAWGCYNHEPENDTATLPAATWRSRFIGHASVMRSFGVRPVSILMGYTLYPASGRNRADWALPAGTQDAQGWDGYFWQSEGRDPADMATRMLTDASSQGLRLVVAETGDDIGNPQRVARTTTFANTLKAGNALGALWWSQSGDKGDATLDAATADAWLGT
jgi:hypothetical protein